MTRRLKVTAKAHRIPPLVATGNFFSNFQNVTVRFGKKNKSFNLEITNDVIQQR
jgi:hypothetical protein